MPQVEKTWTPESEAGWYSASSGQLSYQAYWNGEKWTGATRAATTWTSEAEPGWYPDLTGTTNNEAWWDGEKWTGEIRKASPGGSSLSGGRKATRLVLALVLGFVSSVIFVMVFSGVGSTASLSSDTQLGFEALPFIVFVAVSGFAYKLLNR
jgi:Protein of unknown function (DUF2510)